MTLSILLACKSTNHSENKVIVDEKISLDKDLLKKDIKLEPEKHYRISVDCKDTIVLKVKNPKDEIIGTTYIAETGNYYTTFDIICDGKCGVNYVVEMNSKNGNKINGSWKFELIK